MDCRKGSVLVISQINDILVHLNDEQYHTPLALFNGSTIGKHIRHIYDFYNSVVLSKDKGELDYAHRDRDLEIEINTERAHFCFGCLIENINLLDEDAAIDVVTEFDLDESTLRKRVPSSIGRELMYAYDHAVHHLAIVKMGLRTAFPEFSLDENMGVAPSTIKHTHRQN